MPDHQDEGIPLQDIHFSDEDSDHEDFNSYIPSTSGTAPLTSLVASDFELGVTRPSLRIPTFGEQRGAIPDSLAVNNSTRSRRSSSLLFPTGNRRESLGRYSTISAATGSHPRASSDMRHAASVGNRPPLDRSRRLNSADGVPGVPLDEPKEEQADLEVIKRGLNSALGGEGGWLPGRRSATVSRSPADRPNIGINISRSSMEDELGLLENADSISGAKLYLSPARSAGSGFSEVSSVRSIVFLGDDLPLDDRSQIFRDDASTSARSESSRGRRPLSVDGARSFASKQLSSAVRRIVSNEPTESENHRGSVFGVDSNDLEDEFEYPPSEAIPDFDERTHTLPGDSKELPPLRGYSLSILGPENKLRLYLYWLVTHRCFDAIWLGVLVFQTVVVIYRAVSDQSAHDRAGWGATFPNVALLAVFIYYSIAIGLKVVVSGLFLNPETGTSQAIYEMIEWFSTRRKNHFSIRQFKPTFGRNGRPIEDVSEDKEAIRLSRLAFLRSSWNRLDFITVICYWIYFILANINSPGSHSAINIFRALSSVQLLNWLKVTEGTRKVLQSIKRAAPLMVNVTLFIGVFWGLFALVGTQAFAGSFRRQCVWVNPDDANDTYKTTQFCGGYLDANLNKQSFIKLDGEYSDRAPKGYLCPINSVCAEVENSFYNGTVSFDNILQSLELVFVILGMNGFSDIMNNASDSDYAIAAIFFVASVIVLSWWLFNLFIAVISTSFEFVREQDAKRRLLESSNLETEYVP